MSAIRQPSEPGIAPRRIAGRSPARTTDDLPLPLGPTTARNRVVPRRFTSCSRSSSRPKKSSASASSNARNPLYGFATIAPAPAPRGRPRRAPAGTPRRRRGRPPPLGAGPRGPGRRGPSAGPPRGRRTRRPPPSGRGGRPRGSPGSRRARDRAQASREVQRAAAEAVFHRDRFPASSPIPTGAVDGSDTVASTNRRWRSIAARIACRVESNTASAPSPRSSTRVPCAIRSPRGHDREATGELRGRLVAALLREDRVAADVRDQERPDPLPRRGFVLPRPPGRRRPCGIMPAWQRGS